MTQMPQKVILFVDILASSDFKKLLELYEEYKEATTQEIWEAYPLIERKVPKQHKFDKTAILETFLLQNYCNEYNIDLEVWYYKSLFIFNDDLYIIENNQIKKVSINNSVIMTMRDSWKHPFFKILQQILEKNNGKLRRTNEAILNDVGCMNKFYGLSKLYSKRENYIQDICVPYILHNSDYEVFLEFLEKNIAQTLVLKTDCRQEGKGIIVKQPQDPIQKKEIISFFDAHFYKGKPFFITSAYDLIEEFRLYFVKKNDKYEIYSIKQRNNKLNNQELTKLKNIQIYKNLPVKWNYVCKSTEKFQFASQMAQEILNDLDYETGCLEFALTSENKILFFEVNQMAAPLTFDNEDIQSMSSFYTAIFDKAFKI